MPDAAGSAVTTGPVRLRLSVCGAVQGVGFRPHAYRTARALGLAGWVRNGPGGVEIEVEGARAHVEAFVTMLRQSPPQRARVVAIDSERVAATGDDTFEIRTSADAHAPTAVVLADGATCSECLAEVLDPAARRHRYPFANCTQCGPRFTIVESLPYDRPNTTMRRFAMCEACRREYDDPTDRRFHAQPIACPDCGPALRLWDAHGVSLAEGDPALLAAAMAVRDGRVVAVKGLGGFHLVVDATDEAAVLRLRALKRREEKPLALMVRDLGEARRLCEVGDAAAALLESPEAPIVLLSRREGNGIAAAVAPANPRLGVMLPTTPLHHLLLRAVGRPVVATSGNRSDEPICTDEREALERLGGIADLFLVHDRAIARHVDDSVVAVSGGAPLMIRRARGYAPLPVARRGGGPVVLALGGHLKNTIALALGDQVFVSQHIGDLGTPQAMHAFERVIADFLAMYEVSPDVVAHDLHPDYASTRWLDEAGSAPEAWRRRLADVPRVAVQHHHAHLAACLAERGVRGPALGVTWDGTGLGPDGTVWGGEFLLGDASGFERVASLRPFRLPGGDAAVHEPRRVALALLVAAGCERPWETLPGRTFDLVERRVVTRMLAAGSHAPVTTSAGRLFDAVASLVGVRQRVSFEGQAAMELEAAAHAGDHGTYPMPVRAAADGRRELDWAPLVDAVLIDLGAGAEIGVVSARFHEALACAIASVAREVRAARGAMPVALTGGCFQNLRLAAAARAALERDGFDVLVHRDVPPGDGGISLGQASVATARVAREVP